MDGIGAPAGWIRVIGTGAPYIARIQLQIGEHTGNEIGNTRMECGGIGFLYMK